MPVSTKLDATRQRRRLESLLARLERRTDKVERDLRREAAPFDRDPEERAIEMENEEVLLGLEREGQDQIGLVRAALARLDAGSYERCADCRGAIPAARLQALPYATTCVRCAEARERG